MQSEVPWREGNATYNAAAMLSSLNRVDILVLVICGLALGAFSSLYKQKRPSNVTLPPGPKPLPLIGNILDMPRKDDRLVITHWGKQYGEPIVIHLFLINIKLTMFL